MIVKSKIPNLQRLETRFCCRINIRGILETIHQLSPWVFFQSDVFFRKSNDPFSEFLLISKFIYIKKVFMWRFIKIKWLTKLFGWCHEIFTVFGKVPVWLGTPGVRARKGEWTLLGSSLQVFEPALVFDSALVYKDTPWWNILRGSAQHPGASQVCCFWWGSLKES